MQHLIKQKGFTVVELMIGVTLGLILLGGIVQVYLSTQQTYEFTTGLARVQESARYSVDLMSRDIRMAGYTPCGNTNVTANLLNDATNEWWSNFFDQSLRGFEGGQNNFPSGLSRRVETADALLILRAGDNVAGVNVYDSGNNEFIMQRDLEADWIEDGSLMVACDNETTTVFQAGELTNSNPSRITVATGAESPGNCSTQLATQCGGIESEYVFGNNAQLANYEAVIYYIAERVEGSNDFSLYRQYIVIRDTDQNAIPQPEELLEGVENMQLLYGWDQNGDGVANTYIPAEDILDTQWEQVVSVNISLLLASDDGVRSDTDTQIYRVGNVSIGPADSGANIAYPQDRRKRYVSNATVGIRNANI